MKRLLLICGLSLVLVPAALAAKPATGSPTLSVDCADSCVAGVAMTATGTGYKQNTAYVGCIDGPYTVDPLTGVGSFTPGWCFGLSQGVTSDGSITSIVRMSASAQLGLYRWRILHRKNALSVEDASTTFTLVAPAP